MSRSTSAAVAASANDFKRLVLAAMEESLGPAGFKRKRSTFIRDRGSIVHLVSLQASQSSSSAAAKVTVNVAVAAPGALNSWESKDDVWSGLWRERLAFLSSEPSDKWWCLDSPSAATASAQEIGHLLRTYALPSLDQLSTVEQVLAVLGAGGGRGSTELAQRKNAARLRASLA